MGQCHNEPGDFCYDRDDAKGIVRFQRLRKKLRHCEEYCDDNEWNSYSCHDPMPCHGSMPDNWCCHENCEVKVYNGENAWWCCNDFDENDENYRCLKGTFSYPGQ